MLAIILVVGGILSRLIPHAWNFNPVIAVALFGGVYLSRKQALIVPVLLMAVSDIFLGFHNTMPFTWGAMLLVVLLGFWVKKHISVTRVLGGSIIGATIFFVVTNFGAWLAMYPKTLEGLISCYTFAIPFYRNSVISALIYSVVLFSTYELVSQRVKGTKLSFVVRDS